VFHFIHSLIKEEKRLGKKRNVKSKKNVYLQYNSLPTSIANSEYTAFPPDELPKNRAQNSIRVEISVPRFLRERFFLAREKNYEKRA
jgi:hypothetical protein